LLHGTLALRRLLIQPDLRFARRAAAFQSGDCFEAMSFLGLRGKGRNLFRKTLDLTFPRRIVKMRHPLNKSGDDHEFLLPYSKECDLPCNISLAAILSREHPLCVPANSSPVVRRVRQKPERRFLKLHIEVAHA
jgi:hypothetical protein